jgi:hypothetical protein
MNGMTRAGRTKLDAAIDAARVPVDLVRPPHQVALVAFNGIAWTATPLTSDRSALLAGLGGLVAQPGSRLDAGIAEASAALDAAPPQAMRRMAVLTDGLPDPTTPDDVRVAAAQARARGILIDAIAVGPDADPALLTDVAGDPARFHAAPDAEDLTATFRDLAFVPAPCGGTPTWPSSLRLSESAYARPARGSDQ